MKNKIIAFVISIVFCVFANAINPEDFQQWNELLTMCSQDVNKALDVLRNIKSPNDVKFMHHLRKAILLKPNSDEAKTNDIKKLDVVLQTYSNEVNQAKYFRRYASIQIAGGIQQLEALKLDMMQFEPDDQHDFWLHSFDIIMPDININRVPRIKDKKPIKFIDFLKEPKPYE